MLDIKTTKLPPKTVHLGFNIEINNLSQDGLKLNRIPLMFIITLFKFQFEIRVGNRRLVMDFATLNSNELERR